jgi:hypothetical protein
MIMLTGVIVDAVISAAITSAAKSGVVAHRIDIAANFQYCRNPALDHRSTGLRRWKREPKFGSFGHFTDISSANSSFSPLTGVRLMGRCVTPL